MKSFIVGEWYKASTFYIKFEELRNEGNYNTVRGEYISTYIKLYKEAGYWANTDMENDALNSGPLDNLDEIQEYLPDGHIDKYTTITIKDDYNYLTKLLIKLNII